MANKEQKVDPKHLDELLKDQDSQTVLSSKGLLGELIPARVLDNHTHLVLTDEIDKLSCNRLIQVTKLCGQ